MLIQREREGGRLREVREKESEREKKRKREREGERVREREQKTERATMGGRIVWASLGPYR